MTKTPVTAIVLGAGASRRLGQPKQLLEFKGQPLLQTVVDTALASVAEHVIVAIGGAAPEVRTRIDFGTATIVENLHFTTGCSSSIVAGIEAIDDAAAGFVLMLGDQPGVSVQMVDRFIAEAQNHSMAVCVYDDGLGHPFWFSRELFDDVRTLQGDKAVWKLLESGRYDVHQVRVAGDVPLDVDTWQDYENLLAAHA